MQPLADHPVLEAGAVEPYDRFRPHIGRSLLNWKLQKQAFAFKPNSGSAPQFDERLAHRFGVSGSALTTALPGSIQRAVADACRSPDSPMVKFSPRNPDRSS
jgi:hypothetical protein